MAGFVTANRWATGIETHKTSEGRILCTGVGCVGCFPEVFSEEANELGVCDLDLSGSILGLRPFLDEENSRENFRLNGKQFSRRKKKVKPKIRGHKETNNKERDSSERTPKVLETSREKSGVASPKEMRETSSSVATQTEPSDLGIDGQYTSMLSKTLNDVSKQDLLSFDEGNSSETEENPCDNRTQNGANCNIVEVDDNVNKAHRNPVGLFALPSESRFEKIHDKMYIVSNKNIALSSCENNYNENSTDHARDGVTTGEQWLSTSGEDAVCFFFALEYYNSQRILPDFRVMEIVEALSKVVDLKDIKCVQRICRRWHMVLKSRKYTRLLRNSGLKLRGRVYQLVDDVDAYFDVVQ